MDGGKSPHTRSKRPPTSRAGRQKALEQARLARIRLGAWILCGCLVAGLSLRLGLWLMDNQPWTIFKTLGSTEKWHEISGKMGLVLKDVAVEGRHFTTQKEIIETIRPQYGSPLLSYDPWKIQADLLSKPWIQAALVQRQFPGTLRIKLLEHRPIAFWQNKESLTLIDDKGGLIGKAEVSNFMHLPILTGEDAYQAAPHLINALNGIPEIKKRVSGALYVGKRRWDIILDQKMRVKLPEGDMVDALRYLYELEKEKNLVSRGVLAVDLRIPDRVYLQKPPQNQGMSTSLKGPSQKSQHQNTLAEGMKQKE
jgi:cell division protein FtsQ